MIKPRIRALLFPLLLVGGSSVATGQTAPGPAANPSPAAAVPASPAAVPPAPAGAPAAPAPTGQRQSPPHASTAAAPVGADRAPAATASPVALPKPAPELEQMKVLEGSWHCDGRAPASSTGPEHAYKSTWKFKRDLDDFWWVAEYQQAKAKKNPVPMKARGFLTYDGAAKEFFLVGVDNLGGSSQQSTTGWSGDVITLPGDVTVVGKKVPYREVITKRGTNKNTREFTWRGEMKMGGDWVTLGEDVCKK